MLCRSGRPRNLYCYRSTGDVWVSLYCKGLGLKVYNFNSNLFLDLCLQPQESSWGRSDGERHVKPDGCGTILGVRIRSGQRQLEPEDLGKFTVVSSSSFSITPGWLGEV